MSTNKHEGCIRGFYQHSKSWYNKNKDGFIEEINFGMMHPDGGTTGEMLVSWHNIGEKLPVAKLECYQDGWNALSTFGDLLQRMAEFDGKNIQPEGFVELLTQCGFTDLTETETPLHLKVNFNIYSGWPALAELPTYEDVLNSDDFKVIEKIIEAKMFVVAIKEGEKLKLRSVHMDKDAAIAAQVKIPGIAGVISERGR